VSHPPEEELVDLAIGLDPSDPALAAHVETCPECSEVIAELRRTAGLVSALPANAGWQAPRDEVWSRITDELDADPASDGEATPRHTPTSDASTSPRLSVVRGEDAGGPRPSPSTASRAAISPRRAVGWGVLVAAASLAVGLLAGRTLWQPAQTPSSQDVAQVSQVSLATLDTKQDEGKATVVRTGGGLDLTVATTKPLDQKDGYLEVWLLNADGKRMVSVGVLAPGKASFPISQRLIDEGYVIVDISREPFDTKPAHSGDSLLRGHLPA
jgi:hypothetical protein